MKNTLLLLTLLGISFLAQAATSAEVRAEFTDSMTEMHQGMVAGLATNDADVMFAASMVPHHQGAIDMANIELEHGTDPAMRTLAEEIIRGQGPQITQMNQWISNHR